MITFVTDRRTELDLKDPTWVQKSLSEIRYHEDEKVSIVRTPPRLLGGAEPFLDLSRVLGINGKFDIGWGLTQLVGVRFVRWE